MRSAADRRRAFLAEGDQRESDVDSGTIGEWSADAAAAAGMERPETQQLLPDEDLQRVQIGPTGACSCLVERSKGHVEVHLSALLSRSGRSIINGNWAIDRPGMYEGVGTMFTYRRPNEISSTAGESFLAEGPTNEILDVFEWYVVHLLTLLCVVSNNTLRVHHINLEALDLTLMSVCVVCSLRDNRRVVQCQQPLPALDAPRDQQLLPDEDLQRGQIRSDWSP
ncbi:hypothetical protein cypCar_00024317 [Cyprinus carpio]|nr:hypothetical protein cypCar_00024317 [Cyprinus carpio]